VLVSAAAIIPLVDEASLATMGCVFSSLVAPSQVVV
jgi:hypothetical protein